MTAVKRRYRQYVTCWGCRKQKRHAGRGLCGVCRYRLDETTGELRPPIPPEVSGRRGGLIGGPRAAVLRIDRRDQRLEDFADLASWGVSDGNHHLLTRPAETVDGCEVRILTAAERALAQRFRKDYVLCGNPEEQRVQVGNAVPVNAAHWLGERLLAVLS